MNQRFVCLLATAALTVLPLTSRAQDTAFVRAIRASSAPFTVANGKLGGPGANALARVAQEHQFIMVGEDHGIRELPEFVTALWEIARPAGYRHFAVEIGPITGRRLDTMLKSGNGQSKVNDFLGKYTPYTLPFFFWKEETQMLNDVVSKLPATRDVVWGLDQEFIMSPTYLLERLGEIAPNANARAIASHFIESSSKGEKAMLSTGNPGAVWMVTATDADLANLKSAFNARPGSEAATIIEELALSRDIYGKFNRGRGYESNQQRADLMKRHFLEFYRAAQARGEKTPKVIVKFGANHVFRGPSITNSYELGTFLPEFAITNNNKAFGILVVVAKGTWNAFRPFGSKEEDKTQKYDPLSTDEYKIFDLKSVLDASGDNTWTFVDLRPIRAMSGSGMGRLDPLGRRLLNSFDAIVVVPEGHASVYLR
ncbi:MAG: hypothetical protein ABI556_00500 [Gemmatimonadales bacterium]